MKKISLLIPLLLIIETLNCFAHVEKKNTEGCVRIGGIPGPEDMALDRETGILYVSSHERRIEGRLGEIYIINLNSPNPIAEKVSLDSYPVSFAPHGLHLARYKGELKLFVISHKDPGQDKHSIEVFRVDKNQLSHETTLEDPSLESPNDLFALPDGRIFVSNDHPKGSYLKKLFLDAFRIRSSKISYFDGNSWSLLEPETVLGNGILVTQNHSGELLYWASTIEEKVFQFKIQPTQNGRIDLKLLRSIEIGSGVDNLEPEESGTILVAAHKSLFRFLKHADDEKLTSASQIFRFDEEGNFSEIFSSDGEEISASSTGISYKDRLIIGQVFNPFLLNCPLK
ncbi:MAG: arylesterase [Leptospiraceae bacterium]|nr:arylesterase [Leptospiraceae bacterium]MCP5512825.1 arylesterase [Leptospiraceae bacterium]